MPALLKAARPYNNNNNNNSKDASRDETFSSIIAASRPRSTDRSASIHPFYGGKKSAPKFLHTLKEENLELSVIIIHQYSKTENTFFVFILVLKITNYFI